VLREIDYDANGMVTQDELKMFMADNDMSLLLATIGLEKGDVENIFHFLEEDGRVEAEKLVTKVVALRGQSNKIDFENMLALIRKMEEKVLTAVLALAAQERQTILNEEKRQRQNTSAIADQKAESETNAQSCTAAQLVEQSDSALHADTARSDTARSFDVLHL